MSFKTIVSRKYKVVAGPGAGVTLDIKCKIKYKKQGNKIVFTPANADVNFHSYYDTKTNTEYGEPGLKIKLDELTKPEDVEDFENRLGDAGELHITDKNGLYDEENTSRKLVLSGGWVRHKYKTGDSFGFTVELDSDYGIYTKGSATFLDAGIYAWNDLDNPTDDDDN